MNIPFRPQTGHNAARLALTPSFAGPMERWGDRVTVSGPPGRPTGLGGNTLLYAVIVAAAFARSVDAAPADPQLALGSDGPAVAALLP
jgi:hypothetical protein